MIDAGEYNSDQWMSFQAIGKTCEALSPSALAELRESIQPYLRFRRKVEDYQGSYFASLCRETCFETGLSACCSFESIITFFADQVVAYLLASPARMDTILRTLERPNTTGKCVYLGESGCLLPVRPISCSMFFCDTAKTTAFGAHPEAEPIWRELLEEEKGYTWPTQPVLFDDLEDFFMHRGAESRHMFFHRSPGLLHIKAEAGMGAGSRGTRLLASHSPDDTT